MKRLKAFLLTRKLCSLLLCVLLLVSLPGMCMAAEITPAELTRLDQIFGQLEINNNQLLTDLESSKTDLATAQSKLVQYQQDLATLQAQLIQLRTVSTQAKIDLNQAQVSLQKANQSFEAYNKEMVSETNKLKIERDIGYVLAIFFAVRK